MLTRLGLVLLLCCLWALPLQAATPQAKATPQPTNSTAPMVNGSGPALGELPTEETRDPAVDMLEDRVTRYKFILETLGFSLTELIVTPDTEPLVELFFEGRLNATPEKFAELFGKFPDEQRLLTILRQVYNYTRRDLTNYAAYKVVLRLIEPMEIKVHYRKF